ncbi:MAG: helix-turn-helix domain-containing protein [Synergistaceae bacterium]|nr:helix-turn-helix domain-containing protein [Synergistaceae bacterium]
MIQITSTGKMQIGGVGERIREYRVSMNLSQQRLADSIKADRSYLAQIERGEKEPSYQFLKGFLETTALSSEWLLRGVGPALVQDGGRKDIEMLADAGLERLDCGLYALGDKVYVPMSSIAACCGAGFEVFDSYAIGDAVAATLKEVGTLRPDMLPYAVKTEGRSMEGYGIKEGSTVIINPAEDVFSGSVAMVIYDGRASIKKIYATPDGKDLLASNGEKIHVTHEDLSEEWGPRICGRVMVVISPPDNGV